MKKIKLLNWSSWVLFYLLLMYVEYGLITFLYNNYIVNVSSVSDKAHEQLIIISLIILCIISTHNIYKYTKSFFKGIKRRRSNKSM